MKNQCGFQGFIVGSFHGMHVDSCFIVSFCYLFIANTHTSNLAHASETITPFNIPGSKKVRTTIIGLIAHGNCFQLSNSHRFISLLLAGIIACHATISQQPAMTTRR